MLVTLPQNNPKMQSVLPVFRISVYILLWIVAAVLLGLTAAHVDCTNRNHGSHDQGVVELLVASILCILWVPIPLLALIYKKPSLLLYEPLGILVLYSLFLAGAAINSVLFPSAESCASRQSGSEKAIVAIAWTAWTLTLVLLALIGLK